MKYSIEEKTLTDIGDALRRKHGETRIEIGEQVTKVSKTINATGFDSFDGEYDDNNMNAIYHVVKIEGAEKLYVKMSYQTLSRPTAYVQVEAGEHTSVDTFPLTASTKYGGNTLTTVDLTFENTDVVTFRFYSCATEKNYLGYYAEVTGQPKVEVKNTFNPLDMAEAIDSIEGMDKSLLPTDEELHIGINCSYAFYQGIWDWIIEKYGDRITTEWITGAISMFSDSNVERIPFALNFGDSAMSVNKIFYYCKKLKEVPKMNNLAPSDLGDIFSYCENLREIPEDIDNNWDWSYMENLTSAYSGSRARTFSYCSSLRKIPMSFMRHGNPIVSYGNSIYTQGFYNCHSLDELVNIPVMHLQATWTSNAFNSTFSSCYRVKNIIFETQEDGSPYVPSNWSKQTIDLSSNTGLTSVKSYITSRNSGITEDKEVKTQEDYERLKDDPDWFTTKVEYSRYNKESAIRTIQSLPDASSGTGNVIKFKGAAGSATDGGAIQDMDASVIALAASKGWTVTFA